MGTDVTLSAFTADEAAAVNAFTAAIAEIRRLEALMTDWPHEGQPPSDVLRINAAAGRYFEPSPGFNVFGGLTVGVTL